MEAFWTTEISAAASSYRPQINHHHHQSNQVFPDLIQEKEEEEKKKRTYDGESLEGGFAFLDRQPDDLLKPGLNLLRELRDGAGVVPGDGDDAADALGDAGFLDQHQLLDFAGELDVSARGWDDGDER
jgi:hypothetical protein